MRENYYQVSGFIDVHARTALASMRLSKWFYVNGINVFLDPLQSLLPAMTAACIDSYGTHKVLLFTDSERE